MSLVLRIRLELVPTDRGGRRRPVTDGYRASMSCLRGDLAAAKTRELRAP